MKAVVMAGGEGTRLRPLTSNQPKPMVPILNRPVMEHILELLKSHQIEDVVVTLQFLPQVIRNYFGQGTDLGLNLSYAIEEVPLGTAGSVRNAKEYLDETFVVVSGDAITDFDLSKAIAFHRRRKSMATLILKSVENPLEFGVVITDKQGRIERFLEKPSWGQVFSDTINTGIYILEPEVLEYIPAEGQFDFSQDLFPLLLRAGRPLYGYVAEGYWCDVGSIEQYMEAHHDILSGRTKIAVPGIHMEGDIWIGSGATIDPSAVLRGPVAIGQHAQIGPNATIDEFTVIGNNVVVGRDAHVHRSIIWENAYLGPRSKLHRAIVGRSCDIKQGARVDQGVAIGDDCVIGDNAVINHDVKIYPFKRVDPNAVVNSSIIWESRGMRSLFGLHGVSGLINIDINAEFATRLAMAYGATIDKGSSVMMSRDAGRASRMVKRAMAAGLISTGVTCVDLRVAPPPVNRFNIGANKCVGGVHVQVSADDPQSIEVNFFDARGLDGGEDFQRKVERFFYREDYRRAFYNEIGEIVFPARAQEFYVNGVLRAIDKRVIEARKFKVIIDFGFGSASLVLPSLIGQFGCDIVALNAATSETKTTLSADEVKSSLEQLAKTVKVFRADFGLLMGSNCERVWLVDDKGRPVSLDEALHLLVELVCRYEVKKGKIAVPLSVSTAVDEIAARHGRRVMRTKVSSGAAMEAASRRDVAFAGAQGGRYIFPAFMPSYDAIFTFLKLMEYLAKAEESLSEVLGALPVCHLAHRSVQCSWEQKGLVMRKVTESVRGKRTVLIDGVKVIESDRWYLAIPDPEQPVVKIFAEAPTAKEAQEEVDRLAKVVEGIVAS